MRQDKLVSVIVPIFNGQDYVGKMVDSIKNQTYKNFEVFFINDFSTDKSAEIIKKRIQGDQRFVWIDAAYKLGTAVRGQEYGLALCKGDYYFFLSQDDFLADDLFETCIAASLRYDADVVLPNCIHYYGGKCRRHGKYPAKVGYETILSPKQAFELSLTWQIHGFAFRKMELVRQVGISADYYNSCEYYVRLSYLAANKIAFADTDFYYRQNNANAITKGVKYIHIDTLKTDVMLLDKYISTGYPKKRCMRRYKALVGGWLHWWKKAIGHKIIFTNHGYVFRMQLCILKDMVGLLPKLLAR